MIAVQRQQTYPAAAGGWRISDLTEELFAVIDSLTEANVDYAVCGGLAVAMHGYPRATRDIDLVIQRDSLEAAQSALRQLGYTIPSGIIPFATGTPEAREVFRVSRMFHDDLLTLDLMLVSPILEDVWASRQLMVLPMRQISVVSRSGLAKMKRLAGRLRDLADLEELGLLEDES